MSIQCLWLEPVGPAGDEGARVVVSGRGAPSTRRGTAAWGAGEGEPERRASQAPATSTFPLRTFRVHLVWLRWDVAPAAVLKAFLSSQTRERWR